MHACTAESCNMASDVTDINAVKCTVL